MNEDGRNFPLSPKSERAYTRISHEFDVLFQALQAENDVNQNMPVRPAITHLYRTAVSRRQQCKCSVNHSTTCSMLLSQKSMS